MAGYYPNSLVGRLTRLDNRLRKLSAEFGIPRLKLLRWNLDGITSPKLLLDVTKVTAPVNKVYLFNAVNANLQVSEDTLVVRGIPRQVNGLPLSPDLLTYGIVEIYEPEKPDLLVEQAEVVFFDDSRLTTYRVHIKPLRNR